MLTIVGKRWFQKGPGNTYHSVKVYQSSELIANVDFKYGYGDQYQQTAFNLVLDKLPGLYSPERHANGAYKDYWKFQQDNLFIVSDVSRKKDL